MSPFCLSLIFLFFHIRNVIFFFLFAFLLRHNRTTEITVHFACLTLSALTLSLSVSHYLFLSPYLSSLTEAVVSPILLLVI